MPVRAWRFESSPAHQNVTCSEMTNFAECVKLVNMAEKPLFFKRKIDTKIQGYLKLPEILAIVGPRQSGKTTYLAHLLEHRKGRYISFEDVEVLNSLQQ